MHFHYFVSLLKIQFIYLQNNRKALLFLFNLLFNLYPRNKLYNYNNYLIYFCVIQAIYIHLAIIQKNTPSQIILIITLT